MSSSGRKIYDILKHMLSNWSKGQTKHTNLSVKKISDTMKLRKINNFKLWTERMKLEGKIKSKYPALKKDGDLAELIGVILGDGHIRAFPRTEELSIFSNSNNPQFVSRYSILVENVFGKKPSANQHSKKNCIRIRIYEKNISSRLGVPFSPRGDLAITVPKWIISNKKYIVRYLRGLYEAEGSFSVHMPTYTHKFQFANKNESILKNVYTLLIRLGFHPHKSPTQIQISKKIEVYKAMELLQFRKY